MNQPKVSVIIPVYNVEKYLCECLDSVVNQTLTDIEIICVDDASTDSSCQILRSYAERDRRVRLIEKKVNEGTLSARRTGTLAAEGKYIMYVDSDDYLALPACETAYREITAKKADILQFTCGVEEHGNDNIAKRALEDYLSVKYQRLDAKELQNGLFIRRDVATSLWGKIYDTPKCKLAYRYTPEMYSVVGEDLFWQFRFSCFAESYAGISTIPLYWYRHSVGITNSNWPDLNKYEQSCKTAILYEQSAHFAQHIQKDKDLLKCAEALGTRLCEDCIYIWDNWVPEDKKADAFTLFWNYWHAFPGLGDVIMRVTGKQPAVLLESYMKIPPDPALPNKKNSVPYVARSFTRVSCKLRGGVQCCREHGMCYTFRRTLYHMGLWGDEENPEYSNRPLLKRFSDCCSEHSSPYTVWRILVKLHLARDAEVPALIQRFEAAASKKKKL